MPYGYRLKVRTFKNERMAFEAVQREIVETAIVSGHELGHDDTFFTYVKGQPRTKWSGKDIMVVHSGGRFGAAFTSNPSSLFPARESNDLIRADMLAFNRMMLDLDSDETLRSRMLDYHKLCEWQPDSVEAWKREIAALRLELNRRERVRKARTAA